MSKHSKIEEKDFLLGYHLFSSRLRVDLIKQLDQQFDSAKTWYEKSYCYVLALEQVFLLYEMFEGTLRAFIDREKVPFIDSMTKDLDVQIVDNWLKDKDADTILTELNYKIENFEENIQKDINNRLLGIIKFWQQENVTKVIKNVVIPLFNKMKHKLMLFKKDDSIYFALEDIKGEQASKVLEEIGIKIGENKGVPESIHWIFEIAEQFTFALQDLIALRLFELGMKPEELIKLSEAENQSLKE